MKMKIFTLWFDNETQDFNSNELDDFCSNKRIVSQQSHFFMKNNKPYWTISVVYEQLVHHDKKELYLNDTEKELLARLKIWRKNKAQQFGLPVYLVATNNQLSDIILRKITTKARLSDIKGYGKIKVEKYGKDIIEITTKFFKDGKKQ